MKIRTGFVSNSSSSSFVVCRAMVGDEVFAKIREAAHKANDEDFSGETCLSISKNYIHGRITYHDESGFWDSMKDVPREFYGCGD